MRETKRERLHKAMDALGLTDYRVYTDVPGITKNMMVKLRKGETRDASSKILEPFCLHYKKVNPAWLLTGEGDMFRDEGNPGEGDGGSTTTRRSGYGFGDEIAVGNVASPAENVNVLEEKPMVSYTKGRPYYDVDFIGGFDLVMNDQTVLPQYFIDFEPYNKDGVLWCNITGHSMEPLISSGDLIAIKELGDWRDFILYGEVYGIITEDMRTVKVVTKSKRGDNFLRLVPVNKSDEFQPQDIPVRLITHIFKVLGCMKRM